MRTELCKQAADPKACEERAAKIRSAHDEAGQACAGKIGNEHRDCMVKQMCAQSRDAAKCEERTRQSREQRERIRETCKDKSGEELKACIRQQRG